MRKKKVITKVMAMLLTFAVVLSMMPVGAVFGENEPCPVTATAGGKQLSVKKTTETVTDSYAMVTGTACVYEVAVEPGTESVTISGYTSGNFLAYNYDSDKNWLNGWYDDSTAGSSTATCSVDSNNDNVADYIWVQTPYVKANEADTYASVSNFVCVIKLVYQLPVEITVGNEKITTTDTWVKDGYTYQDEGSNDKSDLYVINAAAGTNEVSIKKTDDSNFLAYNYGKKGWINGWYTDSTVGNNSATLKIDHDGDGAADYIRIQNLYKKNDDETYSGGKLLYALQFVVNGGLPVTKEDVSVVARSDYEQQNIIRDTIKSLSGKTEYASDSDWVTALYANGGTLSDNNKKVYLKKVYGDIVDSAGLGTLAKDVIALVAMGYDPTKIQDAEGNNYNLLAEIYNSDIADLGAYGIYSAPYILLAYDSYKFELPESASLTRDDLISYMLKQQATDGSWGGYTYNGTEYPGTAGDTASVAQALLSYGERTNVATAISKANSFIANNLESSKTSTNYLSYITIYEAMQNNKTSELTADADADTNVIDYLLSNKLADNTFKYGTDETTNKSATIDAFKSLVAYKNLIDGVSATSANIYDSSSRYYYGLTAVTELPSISSSLSDIFIKAPAKLTYKVGETIDLSGLEVTAQATDGKKTSVSTDGITNEPQTITSGTQLSYSGFDTTTTGAKTVTIKYEVYDTYLEKSITKTADFVITVNPADGSSVTKENAVSIGVYDADGKAVVKNNAYTIEAGKTTVMDVLKAVLGNDGKTYTLKASGTYIAEIDGLGEFDKGENSGWMYKVNGNLPNVAASSYTLSGGEYIYWFYTNDWTAVSGATMGDQNKSQVTTSGSDTKITTAPAEVKTSGTTATATITDANAAELVKQAKENNSKEVVINASSTKNTETVDFELAKSTLETISKDTSATVTVKTDAGEINLDKVTLDQIAGEATGKTVIIEITRVSEPDKTQKSMVGTNGQIFRLTVKSGDTVISQFNGYMTVRLAVPDTLKDKDIAAVHITGDKLEKLEGNKITQDKVEFYEFKTSNFSEFALVDTGEVKIDSDDKSDNIDKAKSLIKELKLSAVSSKTTKKNVKITVKMNSKSKSLIKELGDMGYTVKYKYYRSVKKSSNYKIKKTKTSRTYINTAGEKGTKYYYKVRVVVYDGNKVVAQSKFNQCSYAARKWSK